MSTPTSGSDGSNKSQQRGLPVATLNDDSGEAISELKRIMGGIPRTVDRHTEIARPGDETSQIFLIASGWACRERVLFDGRRCILDLYLPGDLAGTCNLCETQPSDSIVTLTETSYYAMEISSLKGKILQNPRVGLCIMHHMDRERCRLENTLVRSSRMPAIRRVAAFLLDLHERFELLHLPMERSTHIMFRLPITQQQLSDYLGFHPIHLNRTLRYLRSFHIATLEGGSAIIQDMNGLKRLALEGRDAD